MEAEEGRDVEGGFDLPVSDGDDQQILHEHRFVMKEVRC